MHDKLDLLQKQMSEFESACRKAGLKLTHQRVEVYRELCKSSDHPSAEALYNRLRTRIPTLSLDTVYRTLATMQRNGLINKVETVESQARFEVKITRHHHLTCRKCNKITDFQWESLDDAILPLEISSWGRIENKNVTVFGICKECMGVNA